MAKKKPPLNGSYYTLAERAEQGEDISAEQLATAAWLEDWAIPDTVRQAIVNEVEASMDGEWWDAMPQSILDKIEANVRDGITEGRSLDQTVEAVQEALGADGNVRAERIARTEMTGALNAGHVVQGAELEEAGIKVLKYWMNAGDEFVRDSHIAYAGPPYSPVEGADANFVLDTKEGVVEVPYPGHMNLPPEERISCRCLAYIDIDESGGVDTSKAFDPNEPRDERGRWSDESSEAVYDKDKEEWRQSDGRALPAHISAVRIPPAWTGVRVAKNPNSEMLVAGKDSKGREQRIYSQAYWTRTAALKFSRVRELMQKQGAIAAQNEANVKSGQEEAVVTALIMATGIRPGSEADTGAEKQAYGATTLEARHVKPTKEGAILEFVGKKGVALSIPVDDKGLAKMLLNRAKQRSPREKLFSVTDSQLRQYVHSLDGGKFKPKDFRTLKGTSVAIIEIKKAKAPATDREYKRQVKAIAKVVAAKLGNTPTVALQSYIDPTVWSKWRKP